jgi:uncharacterized protein YjbI with pentapeptide repeats
MEKTDNDDELEFWRRCARAPDSDQEKFWIQSSDEEFDLRSKKYNLVFLCYVPYLKIRDLDNIVITNAEFSNCDISDSSWMQAELHDVIFEECDLGRVCFDNAVGARLVFKNCKFNKTSQGL